MSKLHLSASAVDYLGGTVLLIVSATTDSGVPRPNLRQDWFEVSQMVSGVHGAYGLAKLSVIDFAEEPHGFYKMKLNRDPLARVIPGEAINKDLSLLIISIRVEGLGGLVGGQRVTPPVLEEGYLTIGFDLA